MTARDLTPDELRAYGAAVAKTHPPLPAWRLDQAAAIYVAALDDTPPKNARTAG